MLCAAVGSRVIVSLIHLEFGLQWVPGLPGPTIWNDFTGLYVPDLKYLAAGFMLYRDIDTQSPPLFLYSSLPFYDLGGGNAAWIPIAMADAFTAPVIYQIVRRFSIEKVALIAGLGYAFSPLAIVNEGYMWMNPQPMTLFLLLSILLLKESRPVLAAVTVGVALLFNQEALFVLPIFLVFIIVKSRISLPRAGGAFLLTVFGVMSPFLVQAPKAVLNHLAFWLPFGGVGPSEPSLLPIAENPVAVTQISQTYPPPPCGSALVPNFYTGTVCGNGSNFYAYLQNAQLEKIDHVASFLVPFLIVLFAAALVTVRRSPNILEMACAFSCIGGLFVFSVLVHPVFGYYFVPVYALIFASTTNGRSLLVGLTAVTLSFFAPEGAFQFIIPVTCLFVITLIQESSLRDLQAKANI